MTSAVALRPEEGASLKFFDQARNALAMAVTVDEVKNVRDQAEALRQYFRQSKQSLDMQNQCAEIKLRAERKAGAMLREMPKQHGARPAESHDVTPPTLSDIGISKMQSSRWQAITSVPEESFERYLETKRANEEEITTAGLLSQRNDAGLKSSASNEWYTPAVYIEAAREVLGWIDVDPASNPIANETVRAKVYYTADDDGLSKAWTGRVWLNPPYGGLSGDFAKHLVAQYAVGMTEAAILLVNANSTDTGWFQPLWDFTLCFTNHRINFESPVKAASNSTHGSVFVYLGPEPQTFARVFSQFGAVVRRFQP